MAMAYQELEAEPPPRNELVLLTDLTLDELWEIQDSPRRRANP
jgi:hypothetical protein